MNRLLGTRWPGLGAGVANMHLGSIALVCADAGHLSASRAALLGGEVAVSNDDFAAVRTDRMWLGATRVEDYVQST
jgi:hypothetical protein